MPDPAEEVVKLAQKCIEKVPVIVLGSGASRPFGISGMPELQHCLLSHVNPTGTSDSNLWRNFTDELRRCNDLELALHNVHLSPPLEAEVVKQTRRLILDDDLKVLASLLTGQVELPLSALLRHLLRSTHSSVTVVTTNYDRLAEYAADAEGLEHTTGFTHGYYRSFGTQAAPTQPSRGSRLVEVLKVHGSVDWFQDANGTALCLPDSAQIFPASRDCPILRKTSCLGFEMAGFGYPAEKRVFFRLPLHASSPKQ